MYHIQVCLTPGWDGEKIPDLGVRMEGDLPAKAGEPLFRINLVTIFKPFATLAEPMRLTSPEGPAALTQSEEETPPVKTGKLSPDRDCSQWALTYRLALSPVGRNPVFDLGHEPGGMNGAGMTFMPAFLTEDEIEYTLSWDLSALPAGAVGVWSFGMGTVRRTGSGSLLMESFYGAGMLDYIHMGNFTYCWFPSGAIPESALMTSRLFQYESRFFQDPGEPYTILARHTAGDESRAGGTALTRSYMYLYRSEDQLDPTWLKFLFAHEMVHNWIHLNDDPFGTCTWYVEGMAEYYSAVLPLRMGAVTREELANQLNKRAADYYENPRRTATNAECGAGLMSDRELTRVPYGKGFFYLTYADSRIRQATHGGKCLDDVTQALRRRYDADHTLQNEAWIQEYGAYVGEDAARQEYESFRDGGVVTPAVDCFEGQIAMEEASGTVRGSGESCNTWRFF